jgi:very-short-patch-repair endonuclease
MEESGGAGAALARIAAGQLGLITLQQALEAGYTRRMIDRRLGNGSIVSVRKGVYRSAFAPETWHQRALAACIGDGRAAAVSHEGAAFLHGLLVTVPERLEVITPRGRSARDLTRLATVHWATLATDDSVMIGHVPVTSIARTFSDLAARLRPRQLQTLLDKAMLDLGTPHRRGRLMLQLDGFASERRSGSRALREALRPWESNRPDDAVPKSVLEAEVLRLLLSGGIAKPECQHLVLTSTSRAMYLDFAWPPERVALEVDGFGFHNSRGAFDNDRLRGNELLVAGWDVLHTTATEARRNPDRLLKGVRAALAARSGLPRQG